MIFIASAMVGQEPLRCWQPFSQHDPDLSPMPDADIERIFVRFICTLWAVVVVNSGFET